MFGRRGDATSLSGSGTKMCTGAGLEMLVQNSLAAICSCKHTHATGGSNRAERALLC